MGGSYQPARRDLLQPVSAVPRLCADSVAIPRPTTIFRRFHFVRIARLTSRRGCINGWIDRRTGQDSHHQAADGHDPGRRLGPVHLQGLSAQHEGAGDDAAPDQPEAHRRCDARAGQCAHEPQAARGIREGARVQLRHLGARCLALPRQRVRAAAERRHGDPHDRQRDSRLSTSSACRRASRKS